MVFFWFDILMFAHYITLHYTCVDVDVDGRDNGAVSIFMHYPDSEWGVGYYIYLLWRCHKSFNAEQKYWLVAGDKVRWLHGRGA